MFGKSLPLTRRPPRISSSLPLLTGRYGIAGSNCHVRVAAPLYPDGSRVFARLVVRDKTRTLIELLPQRRYEYAGMLDLAGTDITHRDLLLETAFIYIEDHSGRSRRLRVDGASQLTLIRQYLDRDREIVQTIDFTKSGNSKAFVRSGFSNPEEGHTWTEGAVSEIAFAAVIDPSQRYELGIQGGPFLPPTLREQKLLIDLNGSERSLVIDRDSPAFNSVKYQKDNLGEAAEIQLRIQISHPSRPCDHGSSRDSRLLGFAFKQIVFSRLLGI